MKKTWRLVVFLHERNQLKQEKKRHFTVLQLYWFCTVFPAWIDLCWPLKNKIFMIHLQNFM